MKGAFAVLRYELQEIRFRLDDIEKSISRWTPPPINIPSSKLLLLEDHVRKTFLALASRGECDAMRVSNLTGRARAVESGYLNQLTRMGWLTKRRKGRICYFRVVPEKEVEHG